tara:strand:+ start:241 stop:594 length:354 start_codon:yes stop_codon:yes gene_type:complete
MRCITYAGESVMTSDDVAEVLVTLTAAIASHREAEAARIPIVLEDGSVAQADLVIGVGNDVLSAPIDWDGDEPDFSEAAANMRRHRHYPDQERAAVSPTPPQEEVGWDPDLDGWPAS